MKIFVSVCEFLLVLIDTGMVQLQQVPKLVMCPVEQQQLLFPQATSGDWDTPPPTELINSTVELPELKLHSDAPFPLFLPTP